MKKGDTVFVSNDISKRGKILDRNEKELATEAQVHQLGLNPAKLGEGEMREQNLQVISEFFKVPLETLNSKLEPSWAKGDVFVPVKTFDEQLGIMGGLPPGSALGLVEVRHYPLGEAAAQLLGYVGKATAEDIANDARLTSETVIGRSGLEQVFDKELRGRDGGGIYILKENGDFRLQLLEVKKEDGKDIHLTIDAEAQRLAFEALNQAPASTVVTSPKTGELLVLASSPSFDPNKMTMGISQEDYEKYANDELLPFLSRFSTRYAPGSTFKTITAGIGLDYGTINPEEEIAIDGLKWQKDESWGAYLATRVRETPIVNLRKALVYSDNIYFAQQTLRLGEAKFREGLNKFIFGEKLDLPMSMPAASLSNEDSFNSEILLADTGYGQGELLISPIQQATMYSVFMNDGAIVYPSLLMGEKVKRKDNVLKASSANLVLEDLIHGVSDEDGYIHSLYNSDFVLAAKTGTAEIKEKQDTTGIENSFLLYFDVTNRNFMGLMMVEDSLEHGTAVSKAAPLVDYLEATYK
jgi:penicillin-binding protein